MLKVVWFQGLSQPKNDLCKEKEKLVEIFVIVIVRLEIVSVISSC